MTPRAGKHSPEKKKNTARQRHSSNSKRTKGRGWSTLRRRRRRRRRRTIASPNLPPHPSPNPPAYEIAPPLAATRGFFKTEQKKEIPTHVRQMSPACIARAWVVADQERLTQLNPSPQLKNFPPLSSLFSVPSLPPLPLRHAPAYRLNTLHNRPLKSRSGITHSSNLLTRKRRMCR